MLSLEIIPFILIRMTDALLQPVFWLVVAFIAYQHRHLQLLQADMFGAAKHSLAKIVAVETGFGLLGGMLGSGLAIFVGIPVNNLGIEFIWPAALLLTLVHMRFLCFAYAGGLVSLGSLFFGWPQVQVPGLIALIAVLHITESVLIAVSGGSGSIPLILRTKRGELVGGFQLQNLWPLPLVLLYLDAYPGNLSGAAENIFLQMPGWWPVLQSVPQTPPGYVPVYTAATVIAALGYADRTIAAYPGPHRRQSAAYLFVYSVVLLIIAVISDRSVTLQVIAAVCAPVGHELVIWLGSRREQDDAALFRPVPDGVMILDVLKGSMAEKLELRTGDVVQKINGISVYRRSDIAEALRLGGGSVSIRFRRKLYLKQTNGIFSSGHSLGAVTVPEGFERYYVETGSPAAFNILKRFWKRIAGRSK